MITPAHGTYSHLEPYEGREVTYALYSLPLTVCYVYVCASVCIMFISWRIRIMDPRGDLKYFYIEGGKPMENICMCVPVCDYYTRTVHRK